MINMMAQSIKPILATTSLLFWEASKTTNGFISRGFDQLFSIGLLMIVLYLLYRDWQKLRDDNKSRDEKMMKLVSNNTVAINNSTDAVKEFKEEQKQTNAKLDKIDDRLRAIENKE